MGKTAESARHSLYSMLNIRTSGTIQAEIDGINNELEQLRRSGTLTGDEMARVTQHAERKIADLRKEMARTSHQSNVLGQSARGVGVAFNGLVGLLGALGISLGAMELIQLAERFNRLEASVRLATGGGVDFITAMQGIADVANSTYNDLENVGELFTRLSRAGGELGLTQQQLLGITKTINQAMQVSGGSAESMDAALTQLIQGLQSGCFVAKSLTRSWSSPHALLGHWRMVWVWVSVSLERWRARVSSRQRRSYKRYSRSQR